MSVFRILEPPETETFDFDFEPEVAARAAFALLCDLEVVGADEKSGGGGGCLGILFGSLVTTGAVRKLDKRLGIRMVDMYVWVSEENYSRYSGRG
jgi:hypothetical protein